MMLTMIVRFIREMMKLSLVLEIFQNGLERRKEFNGPDIISHTQYLNQIFLVFCWTRTPKYPWRPSVSWRFLSPSPFPCDRRS
jgi:hypothetical protein